MPENSSAPLVSVVVPTYNRAHVIAETLESAVGQSYPRLEIIVVDDGSTDGTEQAVAPFLDRVTYLRQTNRGLAATRNVGFERSRGQLVALLDSDDVWNREKVALQVAVMQAHPEVVVVASDFSAFDASGFFARSYLRTYYSVVDRTPGGLPGIFDNRDRFKTGGLQHLPPDLPEIVDVYHGPVYRKLVHGNFLHPPTVMFRRDAGLRAGPHDSAFGGATDYEYLLRLSREGDAAFVDLPLMRYRCSREQMSSDEHLAEIKTDLLKLLNSLAERDPDLRADRAFRRRMGKCLVMAANANAEPHRLQAARYLIQSIALGYVDPVTAKTAAKLLVPRFVLERLRQRRASS